MYLEDDFGFLSHLLYLPYPSSYSLLIILVKTSVAYSTAFCRLGSFEYFPIIKEVNTSPAPPTSTGI